MDVEWFKHRQRIAGVTSETLGEALGRDRTIVSRIYHGRQPMTLDQADVFARLLDVPVSDVLERAGLELPSFAVPARPAPSGFGESDAAPYSAKADDPAGRRVLDMAEFLRAGSGRSIWLVGSRAMILAGYDQGDFMLVDQNRTPSSGDVVVAQVYDWETGTATTVLRRYDPPVLSAVSPDPTDWKPHVVDGRNVKIMGVVTASWRMKPDGRLA